MFERLLVAIDDSEQRAVTLSFALAVARQCGSTVHLCLINAVPMGGRGIPLLTDVEANAVVAEAVRELRAEGIPTEGRVRRSLHHRIAQGIVSSADEVSADAIVLGSWRRRRLGRLLAAGVRERTIRLTTLPVLTAPAPLALPAKTRVDRHEFRRVQRHQARSRSE